MRCALYDKWAKDLAKSVNKYTIMVQISFLDPNGFNSGYQDSQNELSDQFNFMLKSQDNQGKVCIDTGVHFLPNNLFA